MILIGAYADKFGGYTPFSTMKHHFIILNKRHFFASQ